MHKKIDVVCFSLGLCDISSGGPILDFLKIPQASQSLQSVSFRCTKWVVAVFIQKGDENFFGINTSKATFWPNFPNLADEDFLEIGFPRRK